MVKKKVLALSSPIAKSLKPGIPPLAELLGYDQVTHTLGMSAFWQLSPFDWWSPSPFEGWDSLKMDLVIAHNLNRVERV